MGAARQQVMVDYATGWLAGRVGCTLAEAAESLAGMAREAHVALEEAAVRLLGDGVTDASRQADGSSVPLAQHLLVPQQSAGEELPDLAQFAAAHAKVERDRREATLRMQQAILPTPERQFSCGMYDAAVCYQPAQFDSRVGGDWYEVSAWSGDAALVTIGDVAGHGLTAATGMARIGNALRGMTVSGQPPDTLLHWLNDLVCADEVPELVASAAVGSLDIGVPRLRWAQAGHPPPVLVRNREPRLLARPPGLLLGTVRGAEYELAIEDLAPGDRLVFYTDGLVERRGQDIDEGLVELLNTAACCAGATAAAGAAELAARLSPGSDDDVTVLVVAVA
ncbi:MAG: serine/threonine-protein phosphatase [Nocardiopsaceae bacterium]|nr:serine/threonine-protein phosphatase [Nocardiopsaceae bacterium]